jgi:phage terminase Nu1 subunit (DNA packaging protein)
MIFVMPDDANGAPADVSTPMSGAASAAAAVNKKELAAILGCSPQTLSAWVDRFGEAFPVIDRGTNGKEWRFDPPAVIAFLKSKHDAEERETAERAAWLQQYALPGLTSPDDVEGVTKPSDLLALAKVRQIHRREQMEAGLLVPTSDVRMVLTGAVAKLNRFFQSILTQMARKHGWSDAQLRDATAMAHEAQRAFVRDVGTYAPDGADQSGDLLGTAHRNAPDDGVAA